MDKIQKIAEEILKIAKFQASNFHNLIKKDYGSYKSDDLELDRILQKNKEVIAKFVKINEKPNLTKFNRKMKNYAKRFGLKYKQTQEKGENVIVLFERISLM